MRIGRRELIISAAGITSNRTASSAPPEEARQMYGLIGKIITVPGQRDALIGILLQSTSGMPGCLNYIVAKDSDDENAVWVTEVWDSKASHDSSLSLPEVKKAIAAARHDHRGFRGAHHNCACRGPWTDIFEPSLKACSPVLVGLPAYSEAIAVYSTQ